MKAEDRSAQTRCDKLVLKKSERDSGAMHITQSNTITSNNKKLLKLSRLFTITVMQRGRLRRSIGNKLSVFALQRYWKRWVGGKRPVTVTDIEKKLAAEALKRMADQRLDWDHQQREQYKMLVGVVEGM